MTSLSLGRQDGLLDLVDHALESDDIGHLIRLVFEAQPQETPLPRPLPKDTDSATTSQGDAGAGESPLEAVLAVLYEVAEDREAEISQICRCGWAEVGVPLLSCTEAWEPGVAPDLLWHVPPARPVLPLPTSPTRPPTSAWSATGAMRWRLRPRCMSWGQCSAAARQWCGGPVACWYART